jgi:hypothetical protein
MRKLILLLLLALPVATAAGPDLEALIAQAKAAPGEFGAEALLRIASLDSLPNTRRLELAEQAFEHASAARHPYFRRAAVVRNEGAAQLMNRVYVQDLDALSLRLRAVEIMLPLDAKRAAEWFDRIPAVRLPRLTCEDFLVYDPRRFYTVMARVAAAAPGRAERFRFLSPYPRAMTSPVQLAGMAGVLAAADVDDAGFRTLLRDFISAMAAIKGDDRSFTWSQGVGRQIGVLRTEALKREISPLPLLEGYRTYLVFNLSGPKCSDNDIMQGGTWQFFGLRTPDDSDPQASEFASYFNQKLVLAPILPIQPLEVMTSHVSGVAEGLRACEDQECQDFLTRYRELAALPPSSAERNRKTELAAASLGLWTGGSRAGTVQFFLEKSSAYSTLLNSAMNKEAREPVLRGLTGFLEKSPMEESDRAAWLLAVNALVGRATLDPLGYGSYAEELRKSANPIIALFAGLEAAAPRTPDRILPLL